MGALRTRADRGSRWIGEPGTFVARTHDEGAALAAARRRTTPGTSPGRRDSGEPLSARVRRLDEPTELQAGDDVVALAPVAPLAFTVFYRRELPQMVALAAAVAGHERAEDLAQEALLRAHREWDRIGRYDKPGAWTRSEEHTSELQSL